jgi:hypothetical protein
MMQSMARRTATPRLHAVKGTAAPARRGPGRPKKKLLIDVVDDEREMLVILRRKLAEALEKGPAATAFTALTRQLLQVDRQIRAIDLAAKEAAEDPDGDDETADPETSFDPASI